MACFIVPATEAAVTTLVTKVAEKREQETGFTGEERFSVKLTRLNKLLWGGSALLAFEHFWHGELQPFFPFLTAAKSPAEAAEMVHEMSTVGVTMALLVTAVWGVVTAVTSVSERKAGETSGIKEAAK